MKREEIKSIFPDATDEQIQSVMDLNGSAVEKYKSKVTALEADLKEKNKDFDKLNSEFETLKESGASAEDWKVNLKHCRLIMWLKKSKPKQTESCERNRKA